MIFFNLSAQVHYVEGREGGRAQNECFATASGEREAGEVQVFPQDLRNRGRAPIAASLSRARSRPRRGRGRADSRDGRLFTYANLPRKKFSLNAKFLTDGPLIFGAPTLSLPTRRRGSNKCASETLKHVALWLDGGPSPNVSVALELSVRCQVLKVLQGKRPTSAMQFPSRFSLRRPHFQSFCLHSVRTLSRALQHLVAQCLTTIVVQCLHPCSFHAALHFQK